MCIQLDGADILCLTVSTVELTLTLLEVPSLAVVALVLESHGSSRGSQGTTTKCHASCCCGSRVNDGVSFFVVLKMLCFFWTCVVVELIGLVFVR